MHRSLSAAVLVAWMWWFSRGAVEAGTSDALARARDHLAQGDARAAVTDLEDVLPVAESPPERDQLLGLLREAYESAARQAEATGRTQEAEMYRDNLAIINRRAAAGPATMRVSPSASVPSDDLSSAPTPLPPVKIPDTPLPPPRSAPIAPPLTPEPEPTAVAPTAPTLAAPALAPAPEPEPTSPAPPVPSPAALRAELAAADAAFVAGKYDDAGRMYEALERAHRLPREHRDYWAYCRCVEVVRRLNAGPRTQQEWASLNAEIQQICALSPKNWYGEYLRNLAAERAPSRRSGWSRRMVVRGASPEEPSLGVNPSAVQPAPRSPGPRTEAAPAAAPKAPTPATAREAQRAPATVGNWLVRETTNFRIFHTDAALAERVALEAESARQEQVKRWMGPSARGPWSPRCDIYLYPSAPVFHRMTGQPEDSPGFSTMGLNAGRVIARRINLRVDHPNLIKAVLPHEITHVLLADLFPDRQIPRWADEGIAVLSEPSSEQRLRAADLEKPLAAGRLFQVKDLMVMDYPDGQYWGLYYAQSVSLTRFLVEQGTPAQFIQFVQGTLHNQPEAELRRIYQIDGYADLQIRWLAYARGKSAEVSTVAESSHEATTARRMGLVRE
ncbi:MAG: hypothetical protein JO252_23670 [Planctomycetaceae bacterium]|nr:hypothetical protein [Planctomycetaceae bacterium]